MPPYEPNGISPSMLYNDPAKANHAPSYSLYAPGTDSQYAIAVPGSDSVRDYFDSQKYVLWTIGSTFLTISSDVLSTLSHENVQNWTKQMTVTLSPAVRKARLEATLKQEMVNSLNVEKGRLEALRQQLFEMMKKANRKKKRTYAMEFRNTYPKKVELDRQLKHATKELTEAINKCGSIEQGVNTSSVMKRITFGGKIADVGGYVLLFKDLLLAYYDAVTSGTKQQQDKFVEAVLSFCINFALATASGAASGAVAGAVGGVWGVVLGLIVGALVAMLDFIVIRLSDKSIARWFMDACEGVKAQVDYFATKAAEKVAPVAREGFIEMLYRQFGELANQIIPHI